MAKLKSIKQNPQPTQLYYQASGPINTPLREVLKHHGAIQKVLTERSPGSAVHYTPNKTRAYRAVIKKQGFLCAKEATPPSQCVRSKPSTLTRTITSCIVTRETVIKARHTKRGKHHTRADDAVEVMTPPKMAHAHIIAHCLGGPHQASNYYPATQTSNLATYRLCEQHIKKRVECGTAAHLSVEVRYDHKAIPPSVNLTSEFNGESITVFLNAQSMRKASQAEKDVADAVYEYKNHL